MKRSMPDIRKRSGMPARALPPIAPLRRVIPGWRCRLGNLAMFEGSKAKVRMCAEIKHALDRALAPEAG